MQLKRVTVFGFKSFADKVDFEFGPGVTCIVGPNGCGKSNVVDAFKWVLGEQSARSLRGRQMGDMIFNGSTTRRSSSVAQVDLLFDNSDRSIPLDQPEVTVSRKLYRSGESEYLINGSIARLKDIREMFLDTGLGVDAYSVIEQGRVDQLLQSNPMDRRIIFEEAAGISRYKARKKEAERKLERTNQNLLRVADVIEELEKRLRSVKLQAGKARNYIEYQSRLNELRSSFALAEYHRFSMELARLGKESQERFDRVTTLRTQIDQAEVEESEVTLQLDALAREISQADNQLVQIAAGIDAQDQRVEGATRRIEEQTLLQSRVAERLESDRQRLAEHRTELDKVQVSATELQERTHLLHHRIDEFGRQDASLARDLTEAQAVLEDEKAGIIDLLRRSAQMHNEIVRLNTHRESLIGQKGRLSQRDAQISVELETALEQKAQLEHRLKELEFLIAEENARLEEKKAQAARTSLTRQAILDELARDKERRSALLSRRDLLTDLEQKRDGVRAGVRKVLDAAAAPGAPEVYSHIAGLLADIFETDVNYVRVIEAALGDWDQHLFITSSDKVFAEPSVFDSLPGRLTALCEDRLPPIINASVREDVSREPGFIAYALDLVRYPEQFERLARHLLGKTVVVDTLETARKLARRDAGGLRFVTLGGEVVEPDGRISLGPAASEAGLISRKSELREIHRELAELDQRIAGVADRLDRTQVEITHLETVQQELRTAIYEASTDKVSVEASLRGTRETVARLTQEQPLITGEVTLLEQQINEVLDKAAAGGKSLEELEQENKQREELVGGHQERIDDIVDRRRRLQEELTQARVDAGQLSEKRSAAAATINSIRRAIHELEHSLAAGDGDIEQCKSRIADAHEAIAQANRQKDELARQKQELSAGAIRMRDQRDHARRRLDEISQMVKNARAELTAAETQLHELEMAQGTTNVRRDELVVRVVEEMGVNLTERYESYEHAEQDWDQVSAEITDLRGKMERLGNVNLDALTELEELEQRHGFLTSQRDDLTEAHRQLQQLIAQLNQESKDRFMSAFEQISENFRGLFRKLFGGGRADIILEDRENVLDCGIEIVAQPPGKELQAISLMSGGEKSMTAIALLMSIFKTRPAPFAILDEVDAALDEANNNRFNRIVEEFVSQAQFIIVTHSKRTMSIADRLYGITMQEPGVSTRVSVQLAQAEVA